MRTYIPYGLILIGVLLAIASFSMAAIPPVENFAFSTVSTGYDASATSITLTGGGGAKFPSSFPYPVVWWQCMDYAPHTDPNVEIVSVTNRVGDTLTVSRAQEGTSAVNHNAAGKTYCIAQNLTKGMWDAMIAEIGGVSGSITDVVDAQQYASVNDAITAIGGSVKTLRISNNQSISSNATLHPNTTVWCIGSGKFSVATGVTVLGDRPEQFHCDKRQIFALTGTGKVSFSKSGVVYPEWWGAVADGSTDDGPEIQAAHDSLPSTGGTIEFVGGTYRINQEIAVSTSDVLVHLGRSTIDITTISGTGTANVHDSTNVLAAFKLTGSNQRVVGGRIMGATVVSGKNTIGIFSHGSTNLRVGGTRIDNLFSCVWMGGNTVGPLLQNVVCSGSNTHNILLGYWPTATSSPQVSTATLLNVSATSAATGSGLDCSSYAYDVSVLGGNYSSNAAHGINAYPGCQRLTVMGATANSNTLDGLSNVYSTLTGTSAGKLGISSGLKVIGNTFASNVRHNVAIHLPDYSTFSSVGGVEDVVLDGNVSLAAGKNCYYLGLVRSTIKSNLAKSCTESGFLFLSLQDTEIAGNQSWDVGTSGSNDRAYMFARSPTTGGTPPDSTRVSFAGNHGGDTRSGGSRYVNFATDLQYISNSHVIGNVMNNANTTDWQNVAGHTNLYLSQNIGTGSIGTAMKRRLTGSKTWDPPNTADGNYASTTVTVTGAASGDIATCSHPAFTPDQLLFGFYVSASNTVNVVIYNGSGSSWDGASGTLLCEVMQ